MLDINYQFEKIQYHSHESERRYDDFLDSLEETQNEIIIYLNELCEYLNNKSEMFVDYYIQYNNIGKQITDIIDILTIYINIHPHGSNYHIIFTKLDELTQLQLNKKLHKIITTFISEMNWIFYQ